MFKMHVFYFGLYRTPGPEAVLSELWDMRRVWWLPYHFRHSASEETVLQCWKAVTAVYLYGKGNSQI